jgi:hypothetical protein
VLLVSAITKKRNAENEGWKNKSVEIKEQNFLKSNESVLSE